jgi:hypothetical protein
LRLDDVERAVPSEEGADHGRTVALCRREETGKSDACGRSLGDGAGESLRVD